MSLTAKQRMLLKNKIAGSVYGFVIGDVIDATVESMDGKETAVKYGKPTKIIDGGRGLDLKQGEVTDGTKMMFCVINALMGAEGCNDGVFKYRCADRFIELSKVNPLDVVTQYRKGIVLMMQGEELVKDDSAFGSGSLMRALPCALLGREDLNIMQSDMTHPNDVVRSIIIAYSDVIRSIVHNFMEDFTVRDILGSEMPSGSFKPVGNVTNIFRNALVLAGKPTFDECLVGAVNGCRDADTIAAIACSMSGAVNGLSGIKAVHFSRISIDLKKQLGSFIEFALTKIEDKISINIEHLCLH